MIASADKTMEWAVWSLVFVGCAVLSAMYSAAETGIYVMNKTRLELQAESGSRSARILRAMMFRPSNLLAVLLLGTNLADYAATFAVSAMFVMAGYGERAEWYAMAVTTPVLFVLCASVPKNASQRMADQVAHRLAWLLGASNVLFRITGLSPLVRGYSSLLMRAAGLHGQSQTPLGRESLTSIVAEGHASGVLTHSQSIMADRIMRISGLSLHNVMLPMRRVVTLTPASTHQQAVDLFRRSNHTQLPIVSASGKVTGVASFFDVLADKAETLPSAKAKPPIILVAGLTVMDALYHMQRDHAAMAIVEDATGRHVGIVTMKDLVEEIVGEIEAW